MKKKVFKVGDRVRLDPKVYIGAMYCVEHVMTVVEVDGDVIAVDEAKFLRSDRYNKRIKGPSKYFRRSCYTDEITGRRYDECK